MYLSRKNWASNYWHETNLGDLPREIVSLIIKHFVTTLRKFHGVQCYILDETRMKNQNGLVKYGNLYVARSVGEFGCVSKIGTSVFKIIDNINTKCMDLFDTNLMSHEGVTIDDSMNIKDIDSFMTTISKRDSMVHVQLALLKPKFCDILKIWKNRRNLLDHNNWEKIDNIYTPHRYKENLSEYVNSKDIMILVKINQYVTKSKDLLLREYSAQQMVNALRNCIIEWAHEPYSRNPFAPIYPRLRYSILYTGEEEHVRRQKSLCPSKRIENKYEKMISDDSLLWKKILCEKRKNVFLLCSKMRIPIVTNLETLVVSDTPLTQIRCTRYINKERFFFVYHLWNIIFTLENVLVIILIIGFVVKTVYVIDTFINTHNELFKTNEDLIVWCSLLIFMVLTNFVMGIFLPTRFPNR